MAETQRFEIAFVTPLRVINEAPSQARQLLTVTFGNFSITAEGDHVMYTLPVDHVVNMKVAYVDAAGNPATVDGDVQWQSSDNSVAAIEVDPQDSSICKVVPTGTVGQVQVTAAADADIGEGTRALITVADISVVAGEAVSGTIQPVGEPLPKAPTATPRR